MITVIGWGSFVASPIVVRGEVVALLKAARGEERVDALFREKSDQIQRVEELSDAYHLSLGQSDVIVAYLLEVTRNEDEGEAG